MKINSMYNGEFRLKNSPNPDIQLKDWAATPANISYLEGWLRRLLQDDCEISAPAAMLKGVEYKLRHMRKELSAALHSPTVKTPTPSSRLAAAWKAMR